MLLLRTNSHVLYIVHIRPQCEITYSAGAAPAGSAFKEETTIGNKIQHQEKIKAWDERMTTLQGDFVANSKFIVFLLKDMKGTSPDAETDEVIRAAVAKNLSNTRHVGDTRKFVAEQIPHSQQRSSVVSDHLEHDLHRLQSD